MSTDDPTTAWLRPRFRATFALMSLQRGLVGLLMVMSLVGGADGDAWAADASGPAPLLVGTWEAQTNSNAYQIRVSWNPAAGRYEGRLVVQGYTSRDVGFPLGEICWMATPSGNPATLGVREELRSGRGGRTTATSWQQGVLYLDRSTPAQLLTSTAVFRRVAQETGRSSTTGTLSILDAFPSADEVRQKITGRDPVDTAARQFAALKTLADILNGVPTRSTDDRRAVMAIFGPLYNGQGLASRQFGPAGAALAQSYLHDERFTNQITHVVFPAVGKYVDAKNKAVTDARAAAQVAQDAKAAQIAEAKAQAAAEEKAAEEEFTNASPDPAIKTAAAAGVDMSIFGIPLGAPMRTLPVCSDDTKGKPCVLSQGMVGLLALGTLGGFSPPPHSVFLGVATPTKWVRATFGQVSKGVLVRVTVSTDGHGAALGYLKKKYGPPKKPESETLEWIRPGLHITYSPPILEDLPASAGRAATYHCAPGQPDCSGTDELRANFWSALPNAIGDATAMKAVLTPNLVFETETAYLQNR